EAPESAAAPDAGLEPRLRGTVVHGLLERLDFARPVVPGDEELAAAVALHGVEATPDDVADLRGMVERVAGSELRERIAGASRVRAELPFAFTLTPHGSGGRSLLINGVVDVLAEEGARTLVVDWKSDPLGEADPEELVAAGYSTQRLIYALAALKAGAEVVEVIHCFLERPDQPAVAMYESADAERLERELLKLAQGVVEGRFEPSAEPHFALCADCPGRAALCVHDEELTTRLSVGTPS
ncbi:MAG TPA: PD-(D/E)XK nuclease family protein, partial [Thermoleophilaceae bacterium]|nr:PD-(D/E)XK nuclease family protein [Thermoleophilaceae bacterium]